MIATTSSEEPLHRQQSADVAKGDADRPRRCFLVTPWGQPGGGMGRISNYLMQAATANGGIPDYLAIDSRGPGHKLWSSFYMLTALSQIAAGAIRGNVALVHVNVAERGSLWRKGALILGARASGVPVVLHLHAAELIQYYAQLSRPFKYLAREIFRSAKCCVVLGERWRRFVVEELRVDADRVVILYNGVPRALDASGSRSPASHLRILFLGNLMERKGVSDLLAALAREPLSGLNWRATLAGGGLIETYRRKAESLNLLSRVDFPGWVDQRRAAELLAASDVLVLPSYNEGLPLVILEALTAGVPVVCTPVGAIAEVLENEKTALFVQPGDTEGLAKALARLGREPALREKLAAEGRALYEREFSLEVFVTRVVSIYRRYCAFGCGSTVS